MTTTYDRFVRSVSLGLALPFVSWTADAAPTASAASRAATPEATSVSIEAAIRKLALPVPRGQPGARLVDRPIVLDFQVDSLTIRYRSRGDDRIERVAAPGGAVLPFDVHAVRKELGVEYRRRLKDDLEVGLHVPMASVKESRPARIAPLIAAPFFAVTDDVRADSGLADATVFLAHASNTPRRSRRLGAELTVATGATSGGGPGDISLGTGQANLMLEGALKTTRGSFALTRRIGLKLRSAGDVTAAAGPVMRVEPGHELFGSLRGDWALTGWWTASVTADLRAGESAVVDGATQRGSGREAIVLTPSVTYQASEVFEILAGVAVPVHSRNSESGAEVDLGARWRW